MNPQYLPQQPSQYAGPGQPAPGYGPPPGNYPQGDIRPSPAGTPGNYPMVMPPQGPPQRGQPQGFGGPGMPNGTLQHHDGQPQNVRGTHTMPPQPHQMGAPSMAGGQPNQLANQMTGMNISGPQIQQQRPPSQGFPGAPPTKPGLATAPGPSFPPGSFPPAINGGHPHLPPEPQPPARQPPQYTNGSAVASHPPQGFIPGPGQAPPSHPGSGQGPLSHPGQPQGQGRPPSSAGQQPGQMGAPVGHMGPPVGHMGPPGGHMGPPGGHLGPPGPNRPPPGPMAGPPPVSQQPQMGPPANQFGSQTQGPPQGQMGHPGQYGAQPGRPGMAPGPPQGLGVQSRPPGFPPQQGYQPTPPMPGQMPPMGGQMPPQPGQMPPMAGQMPPMAGQMPPMAGQMPPMAGQMPPMAGQMPPQPGQMRPPPGQMGHPPAMPGYQTGPMGHPPQQPPAMGQPGYPPQPGMYPGQQPPVQGGYPGQQPMGGVGPGGYPQQPGQYPAAGQAQPARRLDPDQMPSPIQVMQDDQRNRSGVFVTNQKGLVPPIVTTTFTTHDQGNAGPRFMRSTMYNVPATMDMMKQTAVPFGLVISPLATPFEGEYDPPVVDMGDIGPVRCTRCKAYMCPNMQFVDGGRRFHCLLCKATSDVPAEYFQHLDHTGQRVDRYERPELTLGTFEFVATLDYCRNNVPPKPPAFIFVLDVSYNNVKSGLVQLLCGRMRDIIRHLPRELGADRSNMKVGFITYNNSVHFYNIKGSLATAQMMVVGDVHDMFMPLLDGFLVEPSEAEAVIDSLMTEIPAMFGDTRETETLLAPAIQAGLEALKASECAGKLLVFHSSLPIADAPGKLKNRDDRKLLGTDKEKTVLVPQSKVYNELGQECVAAGCCVDLFLFNNSYIDVATIGQVSRLTGGEVYKYTYFQADLDGERLIADITHDVSRPVAFDAIMRVRTSTGVRPTDFYGHFFMQNTTDVELACIDCDKAIALEIKHDDKLTEEDGVYVQVALLYTSCSGQRRLRILNLALKTCAQMADLYRSCDLDTIVNFFAKQAVFRVLESAPKAIKDNLVNRCAQMLAAYRRHCASPSSAGQLILPECMKLLPLYVNCILKSDAVAGGSEMSLDDRSFVMSAVTTMDIPSSMVFFYPRLLPLSDLDPGADDLPPQVRCSSDKLRDDGAYLLENGIHMFLWIGLNVPAEWVQGVFGVPSAAQINTECTALPQLDTALSNRIRTLVEAVRRERHRSMRLTLVRQRDKMELVFKHFLVEDRGTDSSASYVDFLCHMHKEIRALLS